jgi:hypothetical protein
VNVKVYLLQRLLKLNSNTAGLPSVAEAGVIVYTVGAHHIIDCSSSRSSSRAIVKSVGSAIVSAVVGTLTVPVVAPAGTVTVCEVVV